MQKPRRLSAAQPLPDPSPTSPPIQAPSDIPSITELLEADVAAPCNATVAAPALASEASGGWNPMKFSRSAEADAKRVAAAAGRPPLFAASTHADAAWAAMLPTPARGAQKRPLVEDPDQFRMPTKAARLAPRVHSPLLFILDGLNILKSRNTPTWGSSGTGVPDLEWDQLERACRFYTCRGQKVSVYLPPLRSGHEQRLERCRQEFGEIFVSCRSASDDRFMINTVKLYDDANQHGDEASSREPMCRIVTNDRFEDWKRKGDIDDDWIDRYCIRFAFGPAGFVPSEII